MKLLNIFMLVTIIPAVDLTAQPTNSLAGMGTANLVAQATNGQVEAILELGRRSDPAVVPILESLDDPKYPMRIVAAAHMALAKTGNETAFISVARDLSSADAQAQDEAIGKLTYIADRRAISALAALLCESNWRKEPKQINSAEPEMDKVFHEPLQVLAIRALSDLVPDAPAPKTDRPGPKEIAEWQVWWQANKEKYEESR